jgi:hypothetical protein
MNAVLSVDEVLKALPVRKSKRWLNSYLNKNPTDQHGLPLYRLAGRDKLVYLHRLIESLPCPSRSLPAATKRRRVSTSGVHISESQWTRAAELTGDPSLSRYSSGSRVKSSEANIHRVNFREGRKRS